MIAPTRRGLIGGAIATAAAPALAHAGLATAASESIAAKQKIVRRGRAIAVAPRSGRLVVAHEDRRTIAILAHGRKRLVDVGGQPLEIATSPDGRTAAITTASWDEPGLAIVDLREAKLVKRIDVGDAPFGVAFTAGGKRLIVSGGEQDGKVFVVDAGRLKVVARGGLGDCPRTVAAVPGSDRAWIALNGPDRVVLVNSRTGRAGRSLKTPPLPDRVAISPDGNRLLVSHGGIDSERVSEIEVASGKLKRHRAGRLPSAVGWAAGGRRVVALGGGGQVVAISPNGRRARHEVGGAPRGLAIDGNRAWTVDALSGKIARVRL